MKAKWLFLALAATLNLHSESILEIKERQIQVNGRKAVVYSLQQPNGTFGLTLQKGENFDVRLENNLKVPTSVHWHGLILPNDQDGVAYVTQYPIYPGESYTYQFPIVQAGTFWMHSHFNLQEQRLLSAPLILLNPQDEKAQDVVVLLSDFTFKSPEEIYRQLTCGSKMGSIPMRSDLVDVAYDAFLANVRTLANPAFFTVKPGSKVRLRIINGASGTNFFVSLGAQQGDLIAVDGNRIVPITGSKFELAAAQRIDILFTIPEKGGYFPILAQGEGTDMQTGFFLATQGTSLPTLSAKTSTTAGALMNALERKYKPLEPLPPKEPDQKILLELGGDMKNYIWTINGQAWPNITPLIIDEGSRVEITFKNTSMMAHPMHLHGHVFQVTALNGEPINGAMRDTVLVLPDSTLSIQFDANNVGVWPLHCHLLYHQEGGMMTFVRYRNFVQPLTTGK